MGGVQNSRIRKEEEDRDEGKNGEREGWGMKKRMILG